MDPNCTAALETRLAGTGAKIITSDSNAPGTIDADYRGEVAVVLINQGSEPFEVRHGDRIAQLVVSRAADIGVVEVGELSMTERGSGGHGENVSSNSPCAPFLRALRHAVHPTGRISQLRSAAALPA